MPSPSSTTTPNPYAIGGIILLILVSGVSYVSIILLKHDYSWDAITPYLGNITKGWGNTILISLCSLFGSIAIGVFLTVGQLVPFKPARILARGYVEFVRGMPLLGLILIGYYLIWTSLRLDSKIVFGVVILSLFCGTYLAEIFRAGIESVAATQKQSARAIGLNPVQTYKFVIIPQAIKRVLPASAGQFANLIKDSSLLYVIAVPELMMQAREANSQAYTEYEGQILMAFGYLLLTLPIFFWSRHLEKKFGFDQ